MIAENETLPSGSKTINFDTVKQHPQAYLGKQLYGSRFQPVVHFIRAVQLDNVSNDGSTVVLRGKEETIHYWELIRYRGRVVPLGMVTPDTELLDKDSQTPSGQHKGRYFRLRRNELIQRYLTHGWTQVTSD